MSRKPMADVLGQVYEQFLGKVIRLTSGHQAKVEEKPERPVPARAFDFPVRFSIMSVAEHDNELALTYTEGMVRAIDHS